ELEAGCIDLAKARAIHDLTTTLSPEQAHQVERMVLPRAGQRTLRNLRDRTRTAVLRVDQDGQQRRHTKRREQRRVEYRPAEDGMATLTAYLPAEQAMAAYRLITQQARHAKGPKDTRTLVQVCADVFVDIMLGSNQEHVSVDVQLVLPGEVGPDGTLRVAQGQVPEIVGVGPITTQTALELASADNATWRRILAEPASGSAMDVGRTRYRPPKLLVEHLRVRDRTCIFNGCATHADKCDIDHTRPFPQGPTAHYNTATPCRHHHRLKQQPGWKLLQPKPGVFIWKTPTGRMYPADPDVDYPFIDEYIRTHTNKQVPPPPQLNGDNHSDTDGP